MNDEIVNPFKEKTNWVKKANERVKPNNNVKLDNFIEKNNSNKNQIKINSKKNNIKVQRVAKSFKIFPGDIPRKFDKRINKLQVYFDDLDYKKDYVDSGKYIMFLMELAEKYELYKLYSEIKVGDELNIDKKILLDLLKKEK